MKTTTRIKLVICAFIVALVLTAYTKDASTQETPNVPLLYRPAQVQTGDQK